MHRYRATATCYTHNGKVGVVRLGASKRWRCYKNAESAFKWNTKRAQKEVFSVPRSPRDSRSMYTRVYLHIKQEGIRHSVKTDQIFKEGG